MIVKNDYKESESIILRLNGTNLVLFEKPQPSLTSLSPHGEVIEGEAHLSIKEALQLMRDLSEQIAQYTKEEVSSDCLPPYGYF